jgi:sarcosine oxidase subunit delta
MLLIPCPICGERPEAEFTYAGEAHVSRPADPSAMDDHGWGEFLYARTNPKGDHAERWRHTHGCGRFFNPVRNTYTDKFVATYSAGSPRPGVDPATDSADAPPMRTGTEQWGQA